MLLRLRVTGFKNLIDLDVRFGPLTCIAGDNGVGKSNLIDALVFLGATARGTLLDAVSAVRADGTAAASPASLFFRSGTMQGNEMRFEADLLIPTEGVDDGGRHVVASSTLLRYRLHLGLEQQRLLLLDEDLRPLPTQEHLDALAFSKTAVWRDSVIHDHEIVGIDRATQQRAPDQSIDTEGTATRLWMESTDQVFESLDRRKTPRTMLAGVNPTAAPTAWLAKQELTSWRSLHLETSALRTPDLVTSVAGVQIGPRGEHLPATLRRLSISPPDADIVTRERAEDAPLRVAGWLDRLIGGVQTVGVDEDAARNTLAIYAVDLRGTRYDARALSDGTLRFLALALLESERDPIVICLEEPENGVHPERIPALIDLLEATAVDTRFAVDATNPLKQVILTTHAPAIVRAVPDESLLYAETVTRRFAKKRVKVVALRWLRETWRDTLAGDPTAAVARGYLFPYATLLTPEASSEHNGTRRVSEHPDLQALRFAEQEPQG